MNTSADADQHDAWNGESGSRWVIDADRRDRIYRPIADALLTAAHLGTGDNVLDIGCGCGATTLAAARLVAPAGTATGLDVSGSMLDVARRRARAAGAANVMWLQADAQTAGLHPHSFDVAISRFGTMFFSEPTAAFANIGNGLRPGARLCVATWRPLDANDWLTIPGAVLARYATTPPDAADVSSVMFSQSDPGTVTSVLTDAGYTAIDLDPLDVTLDFGADPAVAVDHLAGVGIIRAALAAIPEHTRPAALDALRATLADHADGRGVHLGAALWLITAARVAARPAAEGNHGKNENS